MASIESEMPSMHAAETGGGGGNIVANNGNANGGNNATTVVSSGPHSNGSGVGDAGQPGANSNGNNNTISAAADSSDNQPGTPQPPNNGQLIGNNEQQQQQQQQQLGHNPYGMYSSVATTTNGSVGLPHMYGGSIYATAGAQPDMQQQPQQQTPFPTYLNSFGNFYHHQQQQQQQQVGSVVDYGLMYGTGGNSNGSSDYKSTHATASSARYHPYLNAPTSCAPIDSSQRIGTPENSTNGVAGGGGALALPQSSAAVSTTTNSLSPRLVSSSSPTSTSTHMQLSGSSATGSPSSNGKQQCKKCGLMCASDSELQEHITNVHGASPYGSSGYASSPYIKEELSSGSQQQSTATQGVQGGNSGELLDLDSQKMVYPPAPGSIQSLLHHPHQMHDTVGGSDPLHSMHSMQQRALPGWEQPQPLNNGMQEGMAAYMQQPQPAQPQTGQQQQADLSGKPTHANLSPYYSPKQSPYDVAGSLPNGAGSMSVKQEYGLIKAEYSDSQNYVNKSFDPTVTADICQQPPPSVQQQQQMMPVSSSPAEFPTTTTGSQDPQQQYRGFEPPSSSSVNTVSLPTKAATWKSNEARRPKTYNCTACNKWFTSSGHLKRHYNTTLHKNAVKSSGQPDPATLPISAHHHPTRDPTTTTKTHNRRNNASAAAAAAAAATAAAAAQQPSAPVQPSEPRGSPDFAQGAGMGMSQYSASPSPTQQMQLNGLPYGANAGGYQPQQQQYLNQVQPSTNSHSPSHINVPGMSSPNNTQTVLNGHPNGLAGPSAPITSQPMPSSHTRGLLNKTVTTITKSEPLEGNYPHNSTMHNRSPQLEEELDMDRELDSTLSLEVLVPSQMDMEMLQQQQQQQMEEEAAATAAVAAERAQEAEVQLRRQRQAQVELERGEKELEAFQHQLLEELEGTHRHYHNNMLTYNPASVYNNMRPLSPLITSHQPYHPQPVRRPSGMVDSIFSPMQPAAVTMPANIMEPTYNILPLGINTPPLPSNSMQLLQPQPPITNTSTATMVNMGNIHMLHNHHTHHHHHQHTQEALQEQPEPEQLVLPSMRSMLHNNTSIQSQVDHINSITPQQLPPITTTITQPLLLPPQPQQQQLHTTNTMPSYQQLQPVSELVPLEPTMTYHTIIGNESLSSGEESEVITVNSSSNSENGDFIQLDAYDALQHEHMITADGQILRLLSSSLIGQSLYALAPGSTICQSNPRSPQEGDLPPSITLLGNGVHEQEQHYLQYSSQTMHSVPVTPKEEVYSAVETTLRKEMNMNKTTHDESVPKITDSSVSRTNNAENTENSVAAASTSNKSVKAPRRPAKRQPPSKRKISPSQCTTTPASMVLPNGRVKCLECDKDFSKNCYLTQHNNSFHSGEYPYRCNVCGKRFQNLDGHYTHVLRHSDTDKPHKCKICDKQFCHKTDLRRHIEAAHTRKKQNICPVCEKSFCRRDHLRKHMETHTRPKVVAKRVLDKLVKKRLFDKATLEKPYRPYENQQNQEQGKKNQEELDQCTESNQTKNICQRNDNMAEACQVEVNDIKTENVNMPPPQYPAPRQRLTSTTVSGALEDSNYTLSSKDNNYMANNSLIETNDNFGDHENSYIVKEEPCTDGMPYVIPEKQLSAFF